MKRNIIVTLGLLVCLPAVGQAASSIVLGYHFLQPNLAGQGIDIGVTGNDNIEGLGLIQLVNGGVGPAPVITAVDILGPGTIFGSVANTGMGLFGPPSDPPSLAPAVFTSTASGTVLANGILAHVTVDTTGIPGGNYAWTLTNPDIGPTDFGLDLATGELIFPTVIDGVLFVESPEPSSVNLAIFAAAGAGIVAYRNRRAR